MVNYQEPDPLDPEGATSNVVPAWWTAGTQVRQYGVGGASTKGQAPSILPALAHPPEAMTTAAAAVRTESIVTDSDKTRYYPAS
jgi:hypothetical protein